jgi:hypothetical protein
VVRECFERYRIDYIRWEFVRTVAVTDASLSLIALGAEFAEHSKYVAIMLLKTEVLQVLECSGRYKFDHIVRALKGMKIDHHPNFSGASQ